MKHVLHALFLALTLVCAGCGKYEVYERNLVYMTQDTLEAERQVAAKQLEQAQSDLSKAQASGDVDRIREAQVQYRDAVQKNRVVETEIRHRARGW